MGRPNRTESKTDGRTVILANGTFPRKGGRSWAVLGAATRVVACDGAARTYRRRFGRWPDVIVGDLDSLGAVPVGTDVPRVVRVAEQETNDLAKAIRLCAKEGWRNPVVVGAVGKREDHAIGNVFRALESRVELVTDEGTFRPVVGRVSLTVRKGAAVSVFAPDPMTRMTSRGLAWPLDGVRFSNLFCATLNRAMASRVTLTADRAVSVFIGH